MKPAQHLLPVALFCLVSTLGCERKSPPTPPAPETPPSTEPAAPPAETPVESAAPAVDEAAKALADKAQEAGMLLSQMKAAVAAGNLADAQDLLKQLQAMKGDLPADLQAQIDSAGTGLSAAKPPTEPLEPADAAELPAVREAAAAVEQAKAMLAKVADQMKDKAWPDAEATLAKLREMKASLPNSLQEQIDSAASALAAAKAADAVTAPKASDAPALPEVPKNLDAFK